MGIFAKKNLKPMKTKWITLLTTFLFVAFTLSCQKEPDTIKQPTNNSIYSSMRVADCWESYDDIKIECDSVLSFPDMNTFNAVYECLENEVESWSDDFETTYTGLDMDSIIDSTGWVEEQPLIDFENHFGFISLRSYRAELDSIWSNTDTSLSPIDPDTSIIGDDEVLATLLNRQYEVKIGNSIYKLYEDGLQLEITDGNCETLDSLRMDRNYTASNLRTFQGIASSDNCAGWKRVEHLDYYDGGNKKIKSVLSMTTYPWGTRCVAKMKSWRKKKFLFWKNVLTTRSFIELTGYGNEYDIIHTCGYDPVAFTFEKKDGYKRKLKTRYTNFTGGRLFKVRNNEVYSDATATYSQTFPVAVGNVGQYLTW